MIGQRMGELVDVAELVERMEAEDPHVQLAADLAAKAGGGSGPLSGGFDPAGIARVSRAPGGELGRTVVTDGPFVESKESIGGYGVFEVRDLDAAIEIARTWPAPGHRIEIRPLVER